MQLGTLQPAVLIGKLSALWERCLVVLGKRLRLFDLGFAVGACALMVVLLHAVVKHAAALYRGGNTP
jgi:hypothetical protein